MKARFTSRLMGVSVLCCLRAWLFRVSGSVICRPTELGPRLTLTNPPYRGSDDILARAPL